MHHIDHAQLLAGGMRTLVWAVGILVAYSARRFLLFVGFTLAAATSAVFAMSNAHVAVSVELFQVTAYASTVTPGLIVASLIMTVRSPHLGRTWRL